jgi:hypothetical protein
LNSRARADESVVGPWLTFARGAAMSGKRAEVDERRKHHPQFALKQFSISDHSPALLTTSIIFGPKLRSLALGV